MAKQSTSIPNAADIQSMFNPGMFQDALSGVMDRNARMASIFLDAASRSTEIATAGTQETLSNLRDLSVVREQPADYATAYGDFLQRQSDLLRRSVEEMSGITQRAGSETTELVTESAGAATANVNHATKKAASTTKKAA